MSRKTVSATDYLFAEPGQTSAEWAQNASRILGVPVKMVYMDEIPYAEENRALTNVPDASHPPDILQKRAEWLRQNWASNLPQHHLEAFANRPAAAALNSYLLQPAQQHGAFPLRLIGRHSPTGAVMIGPDRTLTAKQSWGTATALRDKIEHWPADEGFDLTMPHEAGHMLQRYDDGVDPELCKWLRERDADKFSYERAEDYAKALTKAGDKQNAARLRDVVSAMKKSRALGQLLRGAGDIGYWHALAVDAEDRGQKDVPDDIQCGVAGFTVVAALLNFELKGDTEEGRQGLKQWIDDIGVYFATANKQTENMKKFRLHLDAMQQHRAGQDVAKTLQYLQKLVEAGWLEGHALRTAELMLDAANYFCPSLLGDARPVPIPAKKGLWSKITGGFRQN